MSSGSSEQQLPDHMAACSVNHRPKMCQAQGCDVDVTPLGKYCIKRRLCPEHLKAPSLLRKRHGTEEWRFCQQCGKLELLSCFDGAKRSCRTQLARRRTTSSQQPPKKRQGSTSLHGGAGSPVAGRSQSCQLPPVHAASWKPTAARKGVSSAASAPPAELDAWLQQQQADLQLQQALLEKQQAVLEQKQNLLVLQQQHQARLQQQQQQDDAVAAAAAAALLGSDGLGTLLAAQQPQLQPPQPPQPQVQGAGGLLMAPKLDPDIGFMGLHGAVPPAAAAPATSSGSLQMGPAPLRNGAVSQQQPPAPAPPDKAASAMAQELEDALAAVAAEANQDLMALLQMIPSGQATPERLDNLVEMLQSALVKSEAAAQQLLQQHQQQQAQAQAQQQQQQQQQPGRAPGLPWGAVGLPQAMDESGDAAAAVPVPGDSGPPAAAAAAAAGSQHSFQPPQPMQQSTPAPAAGAGASALRLPLLGRLGMPWLQGAAAAVAAGGAAAGPGGLDAGSFVGRSGDSFTGLPGRSGDSFTAMLAMLPCASRLDSFDNIAGVLEAALMEVEAEQQAAATAARGAPAPQPQGVLPAALPAAMPAASQQQLPASSSDSQALASVPRVQTHASSAGLATGDALAAAPAAAPSCLSAPLPSVAAPWGNTSRPLPNWH